MLRQHLLLFPIFILLPACSSRMAAPHSEDGAANAEGERKTGDAKSASAAAFERSLELQGITFKVSCPNSSSLNRLSIVPSGLEIANDPISVEVDGTVTGAEVADLNVDGSPEIYVYVTSAGSGSYGKLVAYAVNRRKSLSEITLPPVSENPAAAKGYMGHDEFAVVESSFVQRFPIYQQGDANAAPSGKTRQLQYKLAHGEAGWRLKLDKVVEY